jgi:ribonuclease D
MDLQLDYNVSRGIFHDRVGLSGLTRQVLGVKLKEDKDFARASDFRTRPLHPDLLKYTAQEVFYLLKIWDTLKLEVSCHGYRTFTK